jgi:hypothetical protein
LAAGSSRVVSGQPLHDTQLVQNRGLALQVADLDEQQLRLLLAAYSRWVVSGQPLD